MDCAALEILLSLYFSGQSTHHRRLPENPCNTAQLPGYQYQAFDSELSVKEEN